MRRSRTAALTCAMALASGQPASASPATDALRTEHEACQKLRTAGQAAEAGACFERVYVGLTELDGRASRDLFNVLSDTVSAYLQAHEAGGEPATMCRAAGVLRDYLERVQKAEAIRLRRKVKAMAQRVDAALATASHAASTDVCVEAPPTPAEAPKEGEAALPTPAPALKRLPPPRAAQFRGQTRWASPPEPNIELLAAGFGVTLGGAVTSAVGVGLLLYRSECTSTTPDCSQAALANYHDAGYLTLAAGAGILIAGASILFADRLQERRRRATAAPSFGPGGAGIAAVGQF